MSDRNARGQWMPGTSGNPHGRPPVKDSLSQILRERLSAVVQLPDGQEATRGQVLAWKLVDMALRGDLGAIRCILERLEGRVNWADVGPPEEGPRLIRPPFGFPAPGSCPDMSLRAVKDAMKRDDDGGDGNGEKGG